MAIQIPATSASAKPVVVPDHFKLADGLQLALSQLGDGFFPLKGSMTVGGVPRLIKELNGEVVPGTGLQVKVRDFVALIDGVILGDKNKSQFDPTDYTTLAVAAGVSYVVLAPARITGTDGTDRPDFARGVLSVQPEMPAPDSGKILVAQLRISEGTAQVTSGMIDQGLKAYLKDLGQESLARENADRDIASRIGSGVADVGTRINLAKTNFKLDSLLNVQANSMFNGWVDVLSSLGDIDGVLSPDVVLDGVHKRAVVNPGTLTGLLAYFKMEEPGGSVLLDASGNGNDMPLLIGPGGSIGGEPERVAGVSGNAVHFKGDTYGTSRPGLIDWSVSEWTMCAWAKLDSLTENNWGGLLSNRGTAAPWVNFGRFGASDMMYIEIPGGDTAYGFGNIPDTNFHHFALVKSGSSIKVYLDAVLVGTFGFTGGYLGGLESPFVLGTMGDPNGGGYWPWPGVIDEAALLGVALTVEQLQGIVAAKVLPIGGGPTSAVVVSKAHVAAVAPVEIVLIAEGSEDLTFSVSRDDGTTWAAATSGVPVDVSAQPSGTAVRYRAALPAVDSYLDDVAVFWK